MVGNVVEHISALARTVIGEASRLGGEFFPEILAVAVVVVLLWGIRKTLHHVPHSPL
jgi:hypothetical protein